MFRIRYRGDIDFRKQRPIQDKTKTNKCKRPTFDKLRKKAKIMDSNIKIPICSKIGIAILQTSFDQRGYHRSNKTIIQTFTHFRIQFPINVHGYCYL